MSDFQITTTMPYEVIEDAVEKWLSNAIYNDSEIVERIAEQLNINQIGRAIAKEIDYDDISDTLLDKIRDNHMDEVAESLISVLAETVIDDISSFDRIVDAVKATLNVDELNARIAEQKIEIIILQSQVADMSKKKFWKKMGGK